MNLLRSWGIFPAAVVGHSSGEIAAAYTSNAITAKAAIIIAYYREQLSKRQLRSGGMLAVGVGHEAVIPYLIEGVVVACENSPNSVTLSGDKQQINKVANEISDKQPEMFVRHLKVQMAYHSCRFLQAVLFCNEPRSDAQLQANDFVDHMEEVGADYHALLNGHVPTKRMEVPFFSSVTSKAVADSKQLGPSYWRRNLESPVLFYSATRACLNQLSQDNIFLEIGPHSALAGTLRQIFKAVEISKLPVYVPSLVRGKNGTGSLLTAVGQMHLLAVPIKFEVVTPGKAVLTNLPAYPWRHETKYWNESRITREWRTRRFPKHELLGTRILEGNDLEPTWRNILRLEDVPWMQDHKVIDDIVFPAAGYITMTGEAVRQLAKTDDFTLRHVLIKTALVLQDLKTTELMTSLRRVRFTAALDSDWYEVVISSYNGTSWIKHCIGQVRAWREQSIQAKNIGTLSRKVPASTWYSALKRLGLNYGPSFQGLADISAGPKCWNIYCKLFRSV
jgi:acyl transferase domain-containing protein